MLFVAIPPTQLQQGQKMYDDFQQKLRKARTVFVSFHSIEDDKSDHEYWYQYAKPRFFAAFGWSLNFVSDGVWTAENDDQGLSRPARPEDVRILGGFEALSSSFPKLRVSNVEWKTLVRGKRLLSLGFDDKYHPYRIYFDPGTGFPVEFDGEAKLTYKVALNVKLDRSLFHLDHPMPTRRVLANLRKALRSHPSVICLISKSPPTRTGPLPQVAKLSALLQGFPWSTVLRSKELPRMSEPAVYNAAFCYKLTVKRKKQTITCYIDSHSWLPVGYAIALQYLEAEADNFYYGYRAESGGPLTEPKG